MDRFGAFDWICSNVPSYPYCNIFYRQLLDHDPALLLGLSEDPNSAPVGVNPVCGIQRLAHGSQLGNIANTVVAGLSVFLALYLSQRVASRRAAVCRIEFRWFLISYAFTCLFQVLDLGSYFEQGSLALVVLTSIHAGLVAMTFWFLLANALLALQVVEDGTPAAVLPYIIFGIAFFVATTFVSLDSALTFTPTFLSTPPGDLHNITLFILLNIWPGAAALIYFLIMFYVVFVNLQEFRPLMLYTLAAISFVLSQLAVFLLSKVVCNGSGAKIDGSFVATFLETLSVVLLYVAWRNITEEDWTDDVYYGN